MVQQPVAQYIFSSDYEPDSLTLWQAVKSIQYDMSFFRISLVDSSSAYGVWDRIHGRSESTSCAFANRLF